VANQKCVRGDLKTLLSYPLTLAEKNTEVRALPVGVLDSAVAAAATDTKSTAAAAAKDATPEERWRVAARAVPVRLDAHAEPTARRALRSFLLQRRWFVSSAAGGCIEGRDVYITPYYFIFCNKPALLPNCTFQNG
jgi:hypothetical protein